MNAPISATRRFTVPAFGQPPRAVVAASAVPVRVIVRNEGTGGNEDDGGSAPAPLNPFNMPVGPPLTFPANSEQPCLLATEHNDLANASPLTCYVLPDGASDILMLAAGQSLYALSGTTDRAVISVQVVFGEVSESVTFVPL